MNVVIVRYSEIGTKGLNRPYFEDKLISNIRTCLNKKPIIKKFRGRIFIYTDKNYGKLRYIFGISSFSPAAEIFLEDVNQKVLSLIKNEKTFRITAKRIDKNFPKTSQQLNEEIGSFIQKHKKIDVDLNNPQINIGVEIINNHAYIFKNTFKGLNGLPILTEGRAFARVKDKKKSMVAAFLILKRGTPVSTSLKLLLSKFEYGFKIHVRKENDNDKVIITDETNLKNIKREKDKLILSPLIGLTENQIDNIYKKIIEL